MDRARIAVFLEHMLRIIRIGSCYARGIQIMVDNDIRIESSVCCSQSLISTM